MVTDGSRLYLTEFSGDHFIVSHVSVAGGENATISNSHSNPIVLDVVPDSSQILLLDSHNFRRWTPLFGCNLFPRDHLDGCRRSDTMLYGFPTANCCLPKDLMYFVRNMMVGIRGSCSLLPALSTT